jgi:hypothetical protein
MLLSFTIAGSATYDLAWCYKTVNELLFIQLHIPLFGILPRGVMRTYLKDQGAESRIVVVKYCPSCTPAVPLILSEE